MWPPRLNAKDDRSGEGWRALPPSAKYWGVWGAQPPNQKKQKKSENGPQNNRNKNSDKFSKQNFMLGYPV